MNNNCSGCGATIGDGKTLCNSCANKRHCDEPNCHALHSYNEALRKYGYLK